MAKAMLQRAFALTFAVLFLLTTVGVGGYAVWQIQQDNKRAKIEKALTQAQQQQTAQPTTKENQLQGTKLAGFTPVVTVDTLQKIDTVVGNGQEVKKGDTVTAHYVGALTKDGTIFDASFDRGQPATFSLSGVIKGWQDGVPGMKVGGKRRLLIPASLGYGEQGSPPTIGPNEPLVFDIELVKVGN